MLPTWTNAALTGGGLALRLRSATSSSPCRAARLRPPRARVARPAESPLTLRAGSALPASPAARPPSGPRRAGRSACRGSAPAPARRRRGPRPSAARSAGRRLGRGRSSPARPRACRSGGAARAGPRSPRSPPRGRGGPAGERGESGARRHRSAGVAGDARAGRSRRLRAHGGRGPPRGRGAARRRRSPPAPEPPRPVGDEGPLALAADHQALLLEALVYGPHGVQVHPRPFGEAAEARQPFAGQMAGRDQRPQPPCQLEPDRQLVAGVDREGAGLPVRRLRLCHGRHSIYLYCPSQLSH